METDVESSRDGESPEAEAPGVETPAPVSSRESISETEAESFGTWLRHQRELRQISLREIADTSKISLRYLEALEEERFDLLPAPVFAKGFLRQYARYVGLDPEETVNFYLSARAPDLEVEMVAEEPPRRGLSTGAYVAIVVAMVALLVALVWGIGWLGENREPSPTATPSSGAPEQTPAGTAPAGTAPTDRAPADAEAPASDDAPPGSASPSSAGGPSGDVSEKQPGDTPTAPVTPAPVRVVLDFRGDCWTEAMIDGERRLAEIRRQGESLSLEARESVELKLGDGSVVDVEVNGRPYPLDVNAGETVRLQIDLETVRTLEAGGVSGGLPAAAIYGHPADGESREGTRAR